MFLPPIYSVLILAALALVYAFLRWRHGGPLLKSRSDVDGWWARQLQRLWAFRSWLWNAIGGILLTAPDIIVALTPVDLTPLIGTSWAQRVTTILFLLNTANTVFKVRPAGQAA